MLITRTVTNAITGKTEVINQKPYAKDGHVILVDDGDEVPDGYSLIDEIPDIDEPIDSGSEPL